MGARASRFAAGCAPCALHLVLMAARPLLETATVYPAALAVLPATVASLVPYVLLCLA